MKKIKINITWFKSIDSTNSEALRNIHKLNNYDILTAEHQTAGRGQRGNKWLSKACENLTFSLIYKPLSLGKTLIASKQFIISQAVAVGISKYIESKGVEAKIKWPNDIYVRNKKICGVLIENVLKGKNIEASVIGVGFNLNQLNFPDNLVNPTSLSLITNEKYNLKSELKILGSYIAKCLPGTGIDEEEINKYYIEHLYNLKNICKYRDNIDNFYFNGEILGIDEQGRLKVRIDKINSAEVAALIGTIRHYSFKEISYLI